jgi:hypothetical protein
MMDFLQIAAFGAQHGRAVTHCPRSLRGVQLLWAGLARAFWSGEFYSATEIIDDPSDGIRILNQDCDPVTVKDKKTEGREDQEPTCDQCP